MNSIPKNVVVWRAVYANFVVALYYLNNGKVTGVDYHQMMDPGPVGSSMIPIECRFSAG